MASANSSPTQPTQNFPPLPSSASPTSDTSRKRSKSPTTRHEDEQVSPPAKKVRFLEEDENEVENDEESASEVSVSTKTANVELTTSSSSDNFEVPIEDHEPGVNDMMAGGIGTFSPPRQAETFPASISSDDLSVSRLAIEEAVEAMPYCILGRRELEELDVFQITFPDDKIPEVFQITYLGLQRALNSVHEIVFGDGKEKSKGFFDAVLLCEIMNRAGYFPKQKSVNYVEEMVPVVEYGEDDFDDEYWGLVWSQGTVWGEIEMEESEEELVEEYEDEDEEQEEQEEQEENDDDEDNEDEDNEDENGEEGNDGEEEGDDENNDEEGAEGDDENLEVRKEA